MARRDEAARPWQWVLFLIDNLGHAAKEGVTAEEIGAVQAVVMAVSAGRVNAQLGEVERRMRDKQKIAR